MATLIDAQVLPGKVWLLQSIRQSSGRTVITTPDKYTAEFKADMSVSLLADCNTCNSTYSENSATGTLSIGSLGCTMMMCGPNSKDGLYVGILNSITTYRVTGDTLFCFAKTDTLVFKMKPTGAERKGYRPLSSISGKMYTVMVSENSITIPGLNGNTKFARLLDINGACVRQGNARESSITLKVQGLSKGMYLLYVVFRNGSSTLVRVNMVK